MNIPIVKATVGVRGVEFFHSAGRFTREIHLAGRRHKLERRTLPIRPARQQRLHTGEGTTATGPRRLAVDFGTPVLPATVKLRRAA